MRLVFFQQKEIGKVSFVLQRKRNKKFCNVFFIVGKTIVCLFADRWDI